MIWDAIFEGWRHNFLIQIVLWTVSTRSFNLITGINFAQISSVKGQMSNSVACVAGGKGFLSYPSGFSGDTGGYAGESTNANWQWNHTVTDAANIYFNGETSFANAYASGDTEIDDMISIDNLTDFTLKAYNKRAASTSTLTECVAANPGNKALRYSIQLTTGLAASETKSVNITVTDTNNDVNIIELSVTGAAT